MAYGSYQLFSVDTQLSTGAYDSMVKRRLFAPAPDAGIVIVDIDEASLAAMSNEYGRWPWPRDTLGASLDYLQRSGAAGVVFDILMSDPIAKTQRVTRPSPRWWRNLRCLGFLCLGLIPPTMWAVN
jgi:CHASE2 domain-containing sensor protein